MCHVSFVAFSAGILCKQSLGKYTLFDLLKSVFCYLDNG